MEWSVTINTVGDEVTEDQADDLNDRLADAAGVVTHGPGAGNLGATIAVEANTAFSAVAHVTAVILGECASVGVIGREVVDVRAVEWSRLEAELGQSNALELVGVSEVAELLGVTRQRAHTLAAGPTFPQPVARLAAGPVWTRTSISHFLDSWERKPGRPAGWERSRPEAGPRPRRRCRAPAS